MPDFKFWNERWLNNQIGFHLNAPHKSLVEFIEIFKGQKLVFVPLCGKSSDMIFLRKYGMEVVGVEFSEIAIKDFIRENNLTMEKIETDEMILYRGGGFSLYQDDLFKLPVKALAGVTCCYDRASMVAFDYQERVRYSKFIAEIAKDIEIIMAPLLDYGNIMDAGPPFSVTADELEHLYGQNFHLENLSTTEYPLRENLKLKGAAYEKEVTWLLKRIH